MELVETKVCSRCGLEKPRISFYAARSREHLDGLQQRCKDCNYTEGIAYTRKNRNYLNEKRRNGYTEYQKQIVLKSQLKKLLAKFDLPKEDYELLLAQGCSICGKANSGKRRLHFDHDHETGRFRGLLCSNCNTALGLMKDDTTRMKNAIHYLDKTDTTEA